MNRRDHDEVAAALLDQSRARGRDAAGASRGTASRRCARRASARASTRRCRRRSRPAARGEDDQLDAAGRRCAASTPAAITVVSLGDEREERVEHRDAEDDRVAPRGAGDRVDDRAGTSRAIVAAAGGAITRWRDTPPRRRNSSGRWGRCSLSPRRSRPAIRTRAATRRASPAWRTRSGSGSAATRRGSSLLRLGGAAARRRQARRLATRS